MPADDPYRTLGLERGAPLDEVKRAYRRLAKANHPDAAGEAALPRFLAIQEAYDRIAGPDTTTTRITSSSAPRRAWEADPDRAGATYRAYGGRPRPRPGPRTGPRRPAGRSPSGAGPTGGTSSTNGTRPSGGTGAAGQPGTTGQAGAAGQTGRSADPGRPPGSPGARRRRKATLGSTSYDDIDPGAFAPDWGGASWYGTTSGTYWTINPKEYADPRKHGPEYQARARRAGQVRAHGVGAEAPPTGTNESSPEPPEPPGGGEARPEPAAARPAPPPTHTTSSWWEATTGEPSATADTGGRRGSSAPRPEPPPTARSAAPSPSAASGSAEAAPDLSTDAVIASIRGWLDDDHPSSAARIGRAVIGWAPLALGAGWLTGEISGCSRFAATCPPAVAPATWVLQLGLLVLLIVFPRLARIGSIGAIAILGTVFPASVLLFATGDPEGMEFGRSVLGGLIVLAWVAGLAYGMVREVRREVRPVS